MIKKNNLLLLVPLILFIIIILFFYNYNKKTDNKDNVITEKNTEKTDGFVKIPENSKDINILNKAVFSSTKIEDTKNCNSIENKDLKENCISQIKFKYSDINKAESIKDCEKIKNQKDADVCFLNLRNKNITNYSKACEKIKNKDIKDLCLLIK